MKGSDITKILKAISDKKSVSDLQIIEVNSTPFYKSYQLKMKVDLGNLNFWQKSTFWPVGVDVAKWRGDADFKPRQIYHKRVLISNIPSHVSSETLKRTARTVFSDVKFNKLECEKIVDGRGM